MSDPLLSVRDLSVTFDTHGGDVRAVDGARFDVEAGETVCVVGESGSGKTVTCESITGLIDSARATTEGEVRFEGVDLLDVAPSTLRTYRGSRVAHVFQNPQGALDPVYTVGDQVAEAVRNTRDLGRSAAREEAIELLDLVGIPDPPEAVDSYPHELSGGMRQRVAIAIALSGEPDLLIADEPTTALDVTIEAQLVRLLADLQDELGMAMLYVTHDLGIVAEIADRIVVMYAGKVMERGDVFEVFDDPAHPYTRALLECLPGQGGRPEPIGGQIPDPTDPPGGCRFHPRCPHAVEECSTGDQPPLYGVDGTDGDAACVFYGEGRDASVVRDGDGGGPATGEESADDAEAD